MLLGNAMRLRIDFRPDKAIHGRWEYLRYLMLGGSSDGAFRNFLGFRTLL